MVSVFQDLRFGLRMLAKNPAVAALAVLTLALGIGTNAAIFNAANAALWRKLPVADPQSLVRLVGVRSDRSERVYLPAGLAEELRRSSTVFADVITRTDDGLSFSYNGGGAERVVGEVVSPNFFTFLGIRPVLGQGFSNDVQKGTWAPEVVLSYRFWQQRFGGNRQILGRSIRLNEYSFTIVGVSPRDFYSLQTGFDPELRVPHLPAGQSLRQSELLSTPEVEIMARLKPGVSMAQAEAANDAASQQLLRADPENQRAVNPIRQVRLAPGDGGWREDVAQYRTSLLALVALAGMVLLIASFNLANMLLARATARQREFVVRAAIGAGRSRLVRQLLTESTLLALAGGVAGFAIMSCTGAVMLGFLPRGHINTVLNLHPDSRTLGFTVGLTVLAGLVFGLMPALYATRPQTAESLKSDSPSSLGDGAGARFRQALAVGQVALSFLLLAAGGVFERSLGNLRAADPFPQPNHVLLFRMKPQEELYDGRRIRLLISEVGRRMSALPGVRAAGLAEEGPYGSRGPSHAHVRTPDGRTTDADLDMVTPGFFATLGVPLLQGRDFTELDKEGSKPVVIIDELLARRLFAGENPVGKMLVAPLHSQDVPFEIIGVARASRYYDLHQPPPPTYFYNLEQWGPYMPTLGVRLGDTSAESVLAEVRREFEDIDRNVPVFDVRTLQDRVNDSLAQQRLVTDLAAAFGILALGLVAMGLYGLIAFSVARRTREIGIRMALGAERMQILRLIARQGMAIVFIGVAMGLPAAFVLTRLMAGLLYGVPPGDPLTFFGVALVLGTVAALATFIPARPATKVDPMVALRYE